LAGRAWEANLFPLTSVEIPEFSLSRYLQYGGLPQVILGTECVEELHAYVHTYLQQEIQAESLVRKIPAFTRFLQVAALTSGKIINFTSVARDAMVPPSTIREYYQILEDTFIGFTVPSWQKSRKRKAVSTAKFYLFDLGVKNTLAELKDVEATPESWGNAFEHFIALELRAYLSYRRHLGRSLSYWRTPQGVEVDYVVGDELAIEVKSAKRVLTKHFSSLKRLQEENICRRYILVSQDTINQTEQGIEAMHWQTFLSKHWSDTLLE